MSYDGFNGKILRVNLSEKKVSSEDLPVEKARKYLGGTSLGVKYLFDEVPAGTEWNSPENILFIGSGVLGGTHAAGSGTVSVVTKGPMTNGAAATQANGLMGAFMRFSGYDSIIVEGASSEWVYLYIKKDGTAEILDASELVGLDSFETVDKITSNHGKAKRTISVAAIGQAGEHLVRYAAIVIDKDHVASSNGSGAVMGSKKLKAIAIEKGAPRFTIADKEKMQELTNQIHEDVPWTPFGGGTSTVFDGGGLAPSGSILMYNYRQGWDTDEERMEKLDKFGSTWLRENYDGKLDTICWACNATHTYSLCIKDGEYKGEECGEPEYETLCGYGPLIGVYDNGAALHMSSLGDKLGIDANEAGWVLAMAAECYEKGVLSKDDLDGLDLTWGNHHAFIDLMNKIAYREGVGNLCAEGVARMVEAIGGDAEKYAVGIKGGQTPRAVAFKKSWPYILDNCIGQGGKNEGMTYIMSPSDIGMECTVGDDYRATNGDYDQVVEFNSKFGWGAHFIDSLGVCWFPTNGDLKLLRDAICTVTGWDYSFEEIINCGFRTQHLLRTFNARCGRTPEMDKPFQRVLEKVEFPFEVNDFSDKFDDLLKDYYEAMGWDRETAYPLEETLRKYGAEEAIDELWKH